MKALVFKSSWGAHPKGTWPQIEVIGDFVFVTKGPGGGLLHGAYECPEPVPRSDACTVFGEVYSPFALSCNPGGPPCFALSSVPFRIPWALECVWVRPCLDSQHCTSLPPSFLLTASPAAQCFSEAILASWSRCLDTSFGVWAPKKWIGGSGPLAIPLPRSPTGVSLTWVTAYALAQVHMGASFSGCPFVVYQARLLGSQAVLFGGGRAGAPKNHIGGSGLIALILHSHSPAQYGSIAAWLEALAAWVIPFFRSLLVMWGCCLGRLLVWCLPRRSFRACKFCRSIFAWLPVALVIPVGCAQPSRVILCWETTSRARGRRPPCRPQSRYFSGSTKSSRLLVYLGFISLPTVVWASPFRPGTAFWALQFLHAGLSSGTVDSGLAAPCHSNCPDELPVSCAARHSVAGFLSEAPDLPASAVDTPGSDHFASSVSCIGVTVHAPYFPSVVLNFIADKDEGLGALITSIQQLDCLPCPAHDCMVDLKPQRHTGFISLLSYPSILDRMDPPLRAVMFDLSCVGGHLHARVLPRCVSWDNLAAVVCRLINVDIFEEAVTIWVGADQIILDRRTPYHLCHGDVLVFLRSHLGPPIGLAASSFFQHGIEWHRECHPTVSPIATCEAVCDCDRVFTVDMSYFRPLSPEDTALRQSRVSATDHQVTKVTVSPPLNLDGEICVSIYVVTPKQAPAGTTADSTTVPAARYLLDLRILGLMPKLVLGQPTIHDLPDILRAAGIALPSHLCGTLVSNRLFDQVQVLTIGIGPELASSVMCFPALRWPVPEAIPADPIVHSAPPHGAPGAGHFQRCPPLNRPVADTPLPPPRFDRELPVPDPHLVLNLIEDEVTVFDAISYDAGFIVLIPDFVAERVQVRLSTTCTVEEALSDVAETRDTLAAVHFEQLVPVFPQPDPSFACVLALPMWGLHSRIGVFDTRAVDGRLFALALTERLNRASILLHAGLPVVDTFQVFIGDEPTDVHRWFPLHQGVLITILPSDFAFHHGGSLEARLSRDTGWAIPCPSFGGIEGPKFSILSDGLGAVLRVDLDVVTSSAFFKAEAARLFRFDSEKVTVCPSVPRLRNVSVRGDDCDALIVATESICRIPVPPGRPQVRQHVAFIDARLLLSPITWIKAPNGVLDYEHFLRSLHDLAPPGFEVSVQGGRQEHKGRRTLLHIAHGDVLTCVPVSNDHCLPSSISMPGSEQGSEDGDEDSESSSEGTSDHPSPGPVPTASAATDHDRLSASRSRSPRGHTRPLIPAGPLCWTTGLGLASLVLPAKAMSTGPHTFSEHTSGTHVLGCLSADVFGSGLGFRLLFGCVGGWGLMQYLCSGRTRRHTTHCPEHAGSRTAKLDLEPTAQSAREQQVLDHLRSLTMSLGGPRMPGAPAVPPEFMQFVAEDGPVQALGPRTRRVPCTVLKHDYVNEFFEVDLVVPATEAEALQVIQVSRERSYRELFPALHPVTPQPFLGEVVCIASPSHQAGYVSVCLDTTAFDHRLFVARVPVYASWRELVAVADLPPQTSPEVWTDNDCLLADEHAQVHVFTGMCVRFVPPGEPAPESASWHDLLFDVGPRHSGSVRPVPRFPVAYCLAFRGPGRLYFSDSRRPADKRRHIARTLGVDIASLRIFPAVPRPSDIAFCGVACRTAIGACVQEPTLPAQDWCLIHLDCRPIADGWRTVKVFFGALDVRRLLEELDAEAPLGLRTRIRGIPALTELLPVDSGAVLVLYYEDAGLAQAFPMQSAPPATTATPVVSEEQSAPAQSSDMRPPVAQDSYEDLDLGDAAVEASVTGAQAALGPRAHFLILAPEYGPDLVSLNTEFPISVDEVLTQVADLRDPALANRFPQLLPVHIQPAISFACLLALPSWEFAGVPILIVCYVPPFRVMTVVVGALLAPDDILRLVGVPDDGTAQVFYADMPWAIPSGRQVDVQPGALFTVVPIGQPRIPPVTLPAILASVNGWHYDPVLPGPFTGAVWVLTDTGHFRLSYDFRPDLDLPEAMSYIAGVDRADLTILPAHPPVHDHYHQGTPLRQVFMSLADLDEDGVPFFLDQRPVLSTIVWMVARGGRVDVATVCGIHAARCPPTHFVRLLGGFATPGTANHQRFVYPGQVLTVEFQFRRSYYAAGQMPDDNDSSDGSSSDEGGDGSDEDDGPWPDAAATSSNTASSLPDAGTGSTQGCGGAAITQTLSCEDQRVGRLRWATLFGAFCRFCKDAWSEGMDTCLPGLMHDVHHVDSPGFTSAFPCNAFLWDCLEHIFLVLVWVPVWVCACLGQCGLGYPTDGRKSRAILTALIVLYQFDLCSATAELTRVPDRTSAPQGVQCLSNVDHSARRVIATPCRSCHPAPPVSMHSCDSSQETPLGLDRASYGRARRDGSSPAEAPRRDRSTVGSADREKSADTDLVDCVNGPTLLEAVPTGDKLWAWFNAVTLIETLEEHFSDVPPQESHGATEVRQQISLAEVIPLSAFQGQALSLHDLLPGMSDHYQRPEELLDWLDNDLRGVTSDPAVPHSKLRLFFSHLQMALGCC